MKKALKEVILLGELCELLISSSDIPTRVLPGGMYTIPKGILLFLNFLLYTPTSSPWPPFPQLESNIVTIKKPNKYLFLILASSNFLTILSIMIDIYNYWEQKYA